MSEVERTLSEQECTELETLVETWHSLDQRFKLTITEEGNEISSTPSLSEVVAGLQILVAMQSLPNLLATVRELREQLAECQAELTEAKWCKPGCESRMVVESELIEARQQLADCQASVAALKGASDVR